MAISIGSTNAKPYVGSKEVKEAYVGSTLVYSAGPVNPVIFQGTEINYRYSGTNFTETTEGFKMTGASELTFTGVDLSTFNRLYVEAYNTSGSNVSLTVNFIDNSGNVSASITKLFEAHSSSGNSYAIPPEYIKPRAKIKLSSTNGRNIVLKSARLLS